MKKLRRRIKNRMRGFGFLYQRGPVWWICFSVRGERIRESSESTKEADALKLLKRRNAEVHSGKPVGPRIERTTLDDLITMLRDDYKANGRRSLNRAEDAISHLLAFFGESARAVDITRDRVVSYAAQRQREAHKGRPVARATVNYELAILRRAFRLGVDTGKVGIPPKVTMLHVDNARAGFFEENQFRAVVDHLPDYLRPLAIVAHGTGWRVQSEFLTRQWRHVDLDAGWLRLDPGEGKTVNLEHSRLPPNSTACSKRNANECAIWNAPPAPSFLGFSSIPMVRGSGIFASHVEGVQGRSGARSFGARSPTHRSARSGARGVPRSAAMKTTGHQSETVYQRYAIVDDGMLKEAAAK